MCPSPGFGVVKALRWFSYACCVMSPSSDDDPVAGNPIQERMRSLLTIDPTRTVVVTVDMQRRYLDMDIGTSPVAPEDARHVLESSTTLLHLARASGIPVIHAYVKGRPIEAARGLLGTPALRLLWASGFTELLPDRIEGSQQADVPANLLDPTDLHITTKKSMDAYLGTDLEQLLGQLFRAEAVILAGLNTDTCVFCTALSTSNRGFRPIVVSDCVASMRGRKRHLAALDLMSSFAWILTLNQLLDQLESG